MRNDIVPQLRKALAGFSGDLIAEHGKDIQHTPGSGPVSGTSTPRSVATPSSASHAAPSSTKPSQTGTSPIVNTVTLKDDIEFQTSADQLYQTFVDPQRVAAFTRAPPSEFEPREGGRFSLFGRNVEGQFKQLEKDKKIVQTWRLADWPKGKSRATTDIVTFSLSSIYGSAKWLSMLLLCRYAHRYAQRRPLLNPYPCVRPRHTLHRVKAQLGWRPRRPGRCH